MDSSLRLALKIVGTLTLLLICVVAGYGINQSQQRAISTKSTPWKTSTPYQPTPTVASTLTPTSEKKTIYRSTPTPTIEETFIPNAETARLEAEANRLRAEGERLRLENEYLLNNPGATTDDYSGGDISPYLDRMKDLTPTYTPPSVTCGVYPLGPCMPGQR